jgi:hypothetical protein
VNIGDLVEFKHSSAGVRKGSLGLIVMTAEPGRPNYFVYHIQTLDGRTRWFSDSYVKKVTPGLYST